MDITDVRARTTHSPECSLGSPLALIQQIADQQLALPRPVRSKPHEAQGLGF
jgi:hypothetical protein